MFAHDSAIVVGVDVGGTKIALSAFRLQHPSTPIARTQHMVSGDFHLELKHIVDFIQGLTGRLAGIGIAVPGVVNADRTRLLNAANLQHWVDQAVVDRLVDEFGVPVVLGNDVEAQALGEAYYGQGQKQDFLQIGWGTGIGSAFVRRISRITRAFPAEIGHTQVFPMGTLACPCGQFDCLECYAGGAGLEKFYGVPAQYLDSQQWLQAANMMAFAIKNALTVSPANLVIFSGGIAQKQPHLLDQISARLEQTMTVFTAPVVEYTALGSNLGTVGAAALLNQL